MTFFEWLFRETGSAALADLGIILLTILGLVALCFGAWFFSYLFFERPPEEDD